MEAPDVGPKAFASRLKTAGPPESGRLFDSYSSWVRAGAKAQGTWAWSSVLLAGSAFAGVDGWISGLRSPLYLGVCFVALALGAAGFGVAMRREKQWRQANPWSGPAKDR